MRKRIAPTSSDLAQSIDYSTYMGGKGAGGALRFLQFGRMIDMGVGRAHPLGGLRATTVALKSSNQTGAVLQKSKIRKPKKFYSKIAYGNLNFLINKISHGFTEDMIKSLKTLETK